MPLFKSRDDIEPEVLSYDFDQIVAENHRYVYGLALRLVGSVAQLPIEEQAIVTLFYMEDKSIEEISKIISRSIANIKIKLHRIRRNKSKKYNAIPIICITFVITNF